MYSSANVHIAHMTLEKTQEAEPAYSIPCVDIHRLQAHVTHTLIMGCGACLSGLMPVPPEAVSNDGCGEAVAPDVTAEGRGVPVLPEAVSNDGCGEAVAPDVTAEGRVVPVLPEAVSNDGRGKGVAPKVIGEGMREGEGNTF